MSTGESNAAGADDALRAFTVEAALKRAGVSGPCLRCNAGGPEALQLVDGYLVHPLVPDPTEGVSAGYHLVTVAIVCRNCGFVIEHSIEQLGLQLP